LSPPKIECCKRQYHRKEVLPFDDAKSIPTAEDADKGPKTAKLKPSESSPIQKFIGTAQNL
jgi:hypothetical protein